MIVKKCAKCKQIKSIVEFSKCNWRSSGYGSYCLSCEAMRIADYRLRHQDKIKLDKAKYWQDNKHLLKVYHKNYSKRRDTQKVKARQSIRYLVKTKQIPKASSQWCQYDDCDNMAQEYHHYLGYEKEHWLDVIPLCKLHHGIIAKWERVGHS